MKRLTFISCLLLISFTESIHLPRRNRAAGQQSTLSEAALYDEAVFLLTLAQNLQNALLDDVNNLSRQVVSLAATCTSDAQSDPQCSKPVHNVFMDKVCQESSVVEKNGLTECCAKTDPERHDCILSLKNTSPGFLPPFQKPTAEDGCKAYHDNRPEVLKQYLYEMARRAPTAEVGSILHAAGQYDEILKTCCQEADKDACFNEKVPVVQKQLLKETSIQKHTCSILKKFGDRPIQAVKLVALSQKFPKAALPAILKLTGDILHIYHEDCEGDTLESLIDRSHLIGYICSHQDTIASNLKDCCALRGFKRQRCIMESEFDQKPEGLSESVKEEFVTDKDVCQHYAQNKTLHLAKFLYEYGRRHQDLSALEIARLGKGYEDHLEKCCQQEPAAECLEKAVDELNKHVAATKEVVRSRCDIFGKLGRYLFHNELLVAYTKKAPQLSFEELYEYTNQLTQVAEACCSKDDAHRLECADRYTSVVIGNICQRHEEHHINKQICKCCGDSYAFRRECFSTLPADPDFAPTPFSAGVFTFHSDLCTAEGNDLEKKKQKLLVNLIKQRPTITEEQLASVIVGFTTLVPQCCAAEDHDACFATEGPKLVEKIRADLGEH